MLRMEKSVEKDIQDGKRDQFSQVRAGILRVITNGIANMPRDTYDALFKILLTTTTGTLRNKLRRLQNDHELESYMEILKILSLDDEELNILKDAIHDQINE